MKKIIACLVVLFLFVGCAQQATQDGTDEGTSDSEATVSEETTKPAEVVSSVLSDEVLAALNEELGPGVKGTGLSPNHITLKYGERAVFGVGLQNIMNAEENFLVKVAFDKAYDKYTNPISTSEEMMEGWIKTNLEEFPLLPNEKKIVSVVIDVEQVMPGIRPPAGTYTFDVELLYSQSGRHINKDYVGRTEFSIRVEK